MNESLITTSGWVPFYGLAGAVLTLPWSVAGLRRSGPRPAAYFNLLMTVFAFAHSLALLAGVWGRPAESVSFTWLSVYDLQLTLGIEVSPVSIGAVAVITGLSLLAQVYALGYMEKDWALARFFGLMGFFEGAICGLALSNSLLLSYGLLEVLTLSTYLLVGFWYAQPLVVTAARDAFLTKRVGDLLLLMGVVTLATLAPSLEFPDLAAWAKTAQLPPVVTTLLGLALIAGPLGKCAQIPLHFWLDEAMEGPNPASILRNSVVVATGAWVLIKLQPVLALSPVASTALVVIGTVTAIGASLIPLAQVDIKRAVSHSTSAYLGLVFIAVGLHQNEVALLLLFAHALAKALLFMSTGSVILVTSTQDLTEMGGLGTRLPATTTAFLVGGAASIALLPLGCFWAMLDASSRLWEISPWLVGVLVAVNGLAAVNLARIFELVFRGTPRPKTRRAPEVAWQMAAPMVSLIIVNLLVPVILWQWNLLPVERSVPLWVLGGSLAASGAAGWLLGSLITRSAKELAALPWPSALASAAVGVRHFLANDLYIERFYRRTIVRWVERASVLLSQVDRHVIDGLVNLMGLATILGGEALRRSNQGRPQFYLLTILLGVVAVFAYGLMTTMR